MNFYIKRNISFLFTHSNPVLVTPVNEFDCISHIAVIRKELKLSTVLNSTPFPFSMQAKSLRDWDRQYSWIFSRNYFSSISKYSITSHANDAISFVGVFFADVPSFAIIYFSTTKRSFLSVVIHTGFPLKLLCEIYPRVEGKLVTEQRGWIYS